MAVSSRLRLPTELLHMICALAGPADLPALSRVDKVCNEICTPLLYRTIILYDYDAAQKCVETLASDPSAIAFNRDLASLVRTFLLHESCHEALPVQPGQTFDGLLVASVSKMSNIQTLRCTEARNCTLEIWACLFVKPRPSLQSVEILLMPPSQTPIARQWEETFQAIAKSRVLVPRLTELKVHVPMRLPNSALAFLRAVMATCAGTLRILSMTTLDNQILQLIVPPLSALPSLQQLEVQAHALTIPGFGELSQVRSLCIRQTLWPTERRIELPPTHWPALEELACYPEMVATFLPPDAETPRPISTLRLTHASYEHNGGSYSGDICSSWRENLGALARTAHSAVPLKHLSFQIDKLIARRLQAFLPYMQHLESLAIVVTTCPTQENVFALGEKVIAHMPRLSTLLLSDVAHKYGGQNHAFRFARDIALQRRWLAEFSARSATLRHVAFTTEFEWEKGRDGVWYPTELPRNRPVEFGEEGDDEDSEDSEDDDDEDGAEDEDEDGDMVGI